MKHFKFIGECDHPVPYTQLQSHDVRHTKPNGGLEVRERCRLTARQAAMSYYATFGGCIAEGGSGRVLLSLQLMDNSRWNCDGWVGDSLSERMLSERLNKKDG